MIGTQARLPGTLPSPAAARTALVAAKRALTSARANVVALREAATVARERWRDAEDDRATAAGDFEDSDSPAAAAGYLRAVEAVRARRVELAGARLALKEARRAVAAAERAREAADEDLIAIAQGRRPGDA